MLNKLESALSLLRQKKPLVLCLTNYVTMDFMANCLLALGAAPLMSAASEETEELVKISHSVNINIGTLSKEFIEQVYAASLIAKKYHKPIVIDPVGVGASQMRTQSAKQLVPFADVIRGNASEIMALFGTSDQTLGVESTHSVSDAKEAATLLLAQQKDKVIVVSGSEDFITNGYLKQSVFFGSPIMSLITGMGCALTAVIAAFKAVISDPFEAALIGTYYFSLTGQIVATKTQTSGSFRSLFIDHLHCPDWGHIQMMLEKTNDI